MLTSIGYLFAFTSLCCFFPFKKKNVEPKKPATESIDFESKKVAPQTAMRGIALVNDLASFNRINLSQVQGLYVDKSIDLPGSVKELKKKLDPLVLNKPINRDNLLLIKNAILNYYHDHKQRMIAVEIPEQDITSGVVVFVIMKAQISDVNYRGNHWYSKKKVEKEIALHPGSPLNEDELLNKISWINQNPFHYTEAILAPGKQKGQTDLEIVTKDRFPLRVYAGGDNTGVESTGRSRYYAGATWGNAFFVDDLLTYQFTTNRDYDKFHSHNVNYQSFLPWHHIFMLYGGYSEIHPDITNFHSHGKEAQGSFRYKVPFKPLYTNFQHQLYFGFDYKYVTNLLFFVGEVIPSEDVMNNRVNVTEEMLGYQLEYTPTHHQLTFRVELFGSPAKWLPHQSSADYSTFRHDAKPRFFYGTLALGDIYTFSSKESISALLRMQGSANTLIPSEQFKLGGYNTVRGYEESVFISDNGILANLELRSRPFTFFKKAKDELILLAFMDYGWGYNYHAFDGITKTARLWSIGPGLRYNINPYANIRVDYGFKLHHATFDDDKLGKWHVAATISY